MTRTNPRSNHYAFLAPGHEFDAILRRIKDEGVAFGSWPRSRTDAEINHLHQGVGFTPSARAVTSGRLSPTRTSPIDGCDQIGNDAFGAAAALSECRGCSVGGRAAGSQPTGRWFDGWRDHHFFFLLGDL